MRPCPCCPRRLLRHLCSRVRFQASCPFCPCAANIVHKFRCSLAKILQTNPACVMKTRACPFARRIFRLHPTNHQSMARVFSPRGRCVKSRAHRRLPPLRGRISRLPPRPKSRLADLRVSNLYRQSCSRRRWKIAQSRGLWLWLPLRSPR